jgi:glyceraldehyde 3-phosphate dehydrogenase
VRVAINGLGRIGRAVFKILMANPELEVVAVNDLTAADNLAYLLNHDTVYGRYANRVTVKDHSLVVADRSYPVFAEPEPSRLPWGRLSGDLVFECTGRFNRRSELATHLATGAKRVMLSAPAEDDDIPKVVFGVNAYDESMVRSCHARAVRPTVWRRLSKSSAGDLASARRS